LAEIQELEDRMTELERSNSVSPKLQKLSLVEFKSALSKNDDDIKRVVRHAWSIHSTLKNAYIEDTKPEVALFIAESSQVVTGLTIIKSSIIFSGVIDSKQEHNLVQAKALDAVNQSTCNMVAFVREAKQFILSSKQNQNFDHLTDLLKRTAVSLKNLLAIVQKLTFDIEQETIVQNNLNEKPLL